MGNTTFIGDELTGAGFRLAGMRALAPEPQRLLETFRAALQQAPLLIVTEAVAEQLPGDELRRAIVSANPPVAVVPDALAAGSGRALLREVRVTLGMEA